ncbi:MAG: FtsW/RodA/SpoVE family cell cycle protein [Saprospiraceae bacterium]|nr:FtsW/RodA/SpoVE family cell cycle protein [Saprospiraceae bacterium]
MADVTHILDRLKGDRTIWIIFILLTLASIFAVYSSTGSIAFKTQDGNVAIYLFKHIVVLSVGWLLAYLCYRMHYTRFSQIAPMLYFVSIILLLLTLVVGDEVNNAKRWLTIPIINFTFQTSDIAKMAIILYLARAIASKQNAIKDFRSAFIPLIIPVVITCILIAPSNLSTAIVLFVTCIAMMYIGRVQFKFILLLVVVGVLALGLLLLLGLSFPEFIRIETWTSRINDFVSNSDGKYQIQQAKIAIAKGGFFGVGPGNSLQRNFLPSPYSDFIYAIICEEYGLILGGLGMILVYVILFARCISIINRTQKVFAAMLVAGLGLSMTIQALANMAVSVHLVPVTGLNLPVVSMGGTSVVFSCIALGMILSVSKHIEKEKEKKVLDENVSNKATSV